MSERDVLRAEDADADEDDATGVGDAFRAEFPVPPFGLSSSSIRRCLSSFIMSVGSSSPAEEERRSSFSSPSSLNTLTSSDDARSASSLLDDPVTWGILM